MPNHVHLIVVPSSKHGLARPLGEAHRRYALEVSRRHRWTDHLWQERFASFPMDEPYLLAAIRYVLLNPRNEWTVTAFPSLRLPEWLEPQRQPIEASLPELVLPE